MVGSQHFLPCDLDPAPGELGDISQRICNVRFASESGHVQRTRLCPPRAKRGYLILLNDETAVAAVSYLCAES